MQKKKLISIAIALTLQSYYIPAIAAENNDDEKECPSNISSLPKEKRAKLSPTCLATPENDNHWGWVAGGVAALVAGVAIGVENNGGGDSNHSYTPPTPDNGGGINGLATIGVKYSSNDTALHLDAYQWKEDGISDKGFMLNVKKTFR